MFINDGNKINAIQFDYNGFTLVLQRRHTNWFVTVESENFDGITPSYDNPIDAIAYAHKVVLDYLLKNK